MSVPMHRRKNACRHFLDNGFDADKTIAWMKKEFASDETIKRTPNPDKLCHNIITMGGTGRERDMNMGAFSMAFQEFLDADRKAARAKDDARIAEIMELRNRYEAVVEELRNVEKESANRRILALEAAVT